MYQIVFSHSLVFIEASAYKHEVFISAHCQTFSLKEFLFVRETNIHFMNRTSRTWKYEFIFLKLWYEAVFFFNISSGKINITFKVMQCNDAIFIFFMRINESLT